MSERVHSKTEIRHTPRAKYVRLVTTVSPEVDRSEGVDLVTEKDAAKAASFEEKQYRFTAEAEIQIKQLNEWLADFQFRDWRFEVRPGASLLPRVPQPLLSVRWLAEDNYKPGKKSVIEFTETLAPWVVMDRSCFEACVRDMIHRILIHEADEQIFVQGERRWDPHKSDHQ